MFQYRFNSGFHEGATRREEFSLELTLKTNTLTSVVKTLCWSQRSSNYNI